MGPAVPVEDGHASGNRSNVDRCPKRWVAVGGGTVQAAEPGPPQLATGFASHGLLPHQAVERLGMRHGHEFPGMGPDAVLLLSHEGLVASQPLEHPRLTVEVLGEPCGFEVIAEQFAGAAAD